MTTLPRWMQAWASALLVAGLLGSVGSSYAHPAQTAEPLAPAARTAPASLAQDNSPQRVFLPFVFTPEAEKGAPGRQAAKDLWNNEYLPSNNVSAEWTGSHAACTPGETSQAYKDAVLRRLNYFRAAAGVPLLSRLNPEYNRKAQAAALMMSRNDDLSHSPPTSWICYSQDGKEGAGRSNLYLGRTGPNAITGYIQDPGGGNEIVGHRRWILYPQTQEMGTGDVPAVGSFNSSNALYVFDAHTFDPRPSTRDEFVAWPPPGYIPYPVVFTRWSFSYPDADFRQAQVTVTRDGTSQPLVQYTPYPEFGSSFFYGENTLVWEMGGPNDSDPWPKPAADTTYQVTVRNVIVNGQPRDFSYEVIIFDPET